MPDMLEQANLIHRAGHQDFGPQVYILRIVVLSRVPDIFRAVSWGISCYPFEDSVKRGSGIKGWHQFPLEVEREKARAISPMATPIIHGLPLGVRKTSKTHAKKSGKSQPRKAKINAQTLMMAASTAR